MAPKPPAVVELIWSGRLEFAAHLPKHDFVIDSSGASGPTPVELLGTALAGCMAVDVAYILTRGRHEFRALTTKLVAQRSPDEPHRLTSVSIHFAIEGSVPTEAVTRAIGLSRDKYCSVWHSLRQDIDLQVTCDLTP